jgi:group I intron endonuclease
MGCIYKITNLVNNKVYIGQTKYTAEWRWQTHLRDAFDSKSENYNVILHRAIRKYGIEKFQVEEIEQCTTQYLSEKERYWISYYDSFNKEKGYNMTLGGEGSKIYNDEQILQLWNQGYAISEITRLLPFKISAGTVRKILLGNGVNIDEMHKRKRQILVHNNTKAVYQYDKNGNFIKTFYSASQAGRELNISDNNIAQAANGQIKSAGGFLWSYEYKDKIETPKHYNKIMIVGKYTLDNKLVELYTSLTSAATNNKDIGVNRKTLAIYCENGKEYKGFIWKYMDTSNGIIHDIF